ncbi:acetoacetate decarboxylase family protein [Sphingomonas sp.]|uniref:acetoacetate decarboxylase family protein n=1 Tax=Sphingomonas sp. TaxID=28214 RepID=UPI001EC5F303|nr:acetoacetate decarboxylase family protein [Sphingomonas sp.]MBX3594705.1 acetoacetate decarboxylase family protein [Sphingomonas sp.]
MTRLRYVQGPAASRDAGMLRNSVYGIRATYETDREVIDALLPRPLEAVERPEIWLQMMHVTMHVTETDAVEIGALTVGVTCTHEGAPGAYCFHMAMEGESVVTSGRERFGEPKKIAQTHFERDGDRLRATCTRHGIPYFEIEGTIGESIDQPLKFEEHLFCYKGLVAIQDPGAFDGDVYLTRLNWERNYSDRRAMTGTITLRDSAYDPLADIPVRKLTSMNYVEGGTRTGGQILRTVPGEWIAPHWVGRFDDPRNIGVELGRKQAA